KAAEAYAQLDSRREQEPVLVAAWAEHFDFVVAHIAEAMRAGETAARIGQALQLCDTLVTERDSSPLRHGEVSCIEPQDDALLRQVDVEFAQPAIVKANGLDQALELGRQRCTDRLQVAPVAIEGTPRALHVGSIPLIGDPVVQGEVLQWWPMPPCGRVLSCPVGTTR